MNRPGRIILLLPLFFMSLNSDPFSLSAKEILIDRIAAIVNGDPILLSEVEERMPPDQKKDSSALMQTLNQMIDQRLEIQSAHKKGITVSDGEVQKALDDTRTRNGLTDEEAFKKSLEKENLTLDKAREEVKSQILIQKLFQRDVYPEVVLQDKDINTYYQAHQEQFKIPEKREISQILFPVRNGDEPAMKEKVREEANLLLKRLKEGETADNILKGYKDEPAPFTVSDLGSFQKGELLPALDQAAFGTEPGKWSFPVETSLGIHLLKPGEEVRKYRPFEEVSREIRDKLFKEKSEAAIEEWMANLRKNATIDIIVIKDPAIKNQGTVQ